VRYGLTTKGPETEEAMEKNYEIKNIKKTFHVFMFTEYECGEWSFVYLYNNAFLTTLFINCRV